MYEGKLQNELMDLAESQILRNLGMLLGPEVIARIFVSDMEAAGAVLSPHSLTAAVTVAKGIQNEFDPAGHSQLVEDLVDVIPYGMFLYLELLGNFAVLQSVGDEVNHFFLRRVKSGIPSRLFRWIPRGHEEIFDEPNVRVLAEKLSACLRKAGHLQTPAYNAVVKGD
jgi:hypothetical protein